jgi:hypothetical protein
VQILTQRKTNKIFEVHIINIEGEKETKDFDFYVKDIQQLLNKNMTKKKPFSEPKALFPYFNTAANG